MDNRLLNRSLGTSKNLLNAGLRLLRIKLAAARDPIAALGGANAKLASARSLAYLFDMSRSLRSGRLALGALVTVFRGAR